MSYICWINDCGIPRILGFRHRMFESTGVIKYNTRKQFEDIVGTAEAEAAFDLYYREQEQLMDQMPVSNACPSKKLRRLNFVHSSRSIPRNTRYHSS